jgi:predicted AAA+ superfamily ATPase
MEQIVARLPTDECYFWATQAGAEVDLLTPLGGKPVGFEFKVSDAPRLTKSMTIAMQDLGLERLLVVAPVARPYALAPRIDVVPLAEALQAASGR